MCDDHFEEKPLKAVNVTNSVEKKKKQKQPKKQKTVSEVLSSTFPDGIPHNWVDTHCHIDAVISRLSSAQTDGEQAPTFPELLTLPATSNWDACVTVCCEPDSYDPIMTLLDQDTTGKLYAAFGVHPHEADHWTDTVEKRFRAAMSHPRVLAWGECGLDYFYDNAPRDVQQRVFVRQMEVAVELGKPLVVHTREAEEDTVRLMKEHLPRDWRVHIHCCTSSRQMVIPLMEHFPNLFVGFTGCITFGNADSIRDTLSAVPVTRLLLETDAPYMAPTPFRGQVCHSGMVPLIAVRMAEVKGVSLQQLLEQVRLNTTAMYGI